MVAALKGLIDICDYLLGIGINLDHQNKKGSTALHLCTNPQIGSRMIQNGANVNLPDELNKTPLLYHCELQHQNMARLLMSHANVHAVDWSNRGVAHYLAMNGNLELLDYALKNTDVRIDSPCIEGMTPLYRACENNHKDICLELLKYGASPIFESGLMPKMSDEVMEIIDSFTLEYFGQNRPSFAMVMRILSYHQRRIVVFMSRDAITLNISKMEFADFIFLAVLLKQEFSCITDMHDLTEKYVFENPQHTIFAINRMNRFLLFIQSHEEISKHEFVTKFLTGGKLPVRYS